VAGRIRDEDVALVRERTNIADVVSEYVTLKPAGQGTVKGLCPFHDEKTPSFNVSITKGVYFCYGCGAGGDAITFLTTLERLTFVEAVERLAAKAGVQLHYVEAGPAPTRPQGQRQRLVAANAAAAEFYAEQIGTPAAQAARQFLAERGFDKQAAQDYGCGFAPEGWDTLTRYLQQKGFTAQELVTAGLAKPARSGSLIDRFRRRLIWPIRDLAGDVIGFGARKIFDDDDGPKYLNTPETPLYKKSQVLYGIERAKREIGKQGRAVIVEGYTDVMACHLAGVPTAVATCGTAFGPEHITVLRRLLMDTDAYRGEIIFTFDGDAAGQKAALRAFEDDQRFVAQTYVAVSPDNMDPCELRLARGDVAVRDLIARRTPMLEFALRSTVEKYNLDEAEGRVAALKVAAPLVARIKDRALRPEYTRRLAGLLGMEVDVVTRAVNHAQARATDRPGPDRSGADRTANGAPAAPAQRPAAGPYAQAARPVPYAQAARPVDPRTLVEREALKLALQEPALAGPVFDAVDESMYAFPPHVAIRRAIATAGGAAGASGGAVWIEAVRDACDDLMAKALVSELAVEPLKVAEAPDPHYVHVQVAQLQLYALSGQIADLKSRLQRMNPLEQRDEYHRVFGELLSLESHARALREQVTSAL
jgi:DNA primase